jgi:hypothetical protein
VLLPEFILEQIPFTIEYWDAAGARCEQTAHPSASLFEQARTEHHKRLIAHYGMRVREWMPEPL